MHREIIVKLTSSELEKIHHLGLNTKIRKFLNFRLFFTIKKDIPLVKIVNIYKD